MLGAGPTIATDYNSLRDLSVGERRQHAVAIEHMSLGEWFIAGVPVQTHAPNNFYLDIKVTEGTNSKDEKALFIGRVLVAMEGMMGSLAPASYVVEREVCGDTWGYLGQTQEFRYIEVQPM